MSTQSSSSLYLSAHQSHTLNVMLSSPMVPTFRLSPARTHSRRCPHFGQRPWSLRKPSTSLLCRHHYRTKQTQCDCRTTLLSFPAYALCKLAYVYSSWRQKSRGRIVLSELLFVPILE